MQSIKMNVLVITILLLLLQSTILVSASEEKESSSSSSRELQDPYTFQFTIPEWLKPSDKGGKLSLLPTNELSVVDCTIQEQMAASCNFFDQTSGMFMCRRAGLVRYSFCTPIVMGNVMGMEDDMCGCCGQVCPNQCSCSCDNGNGIMIQTRFLFVWTKQRCVSKNVADYLVALRREISCDTTCLAE